MKKTTRHNIKEHFWSKVNKKGPYPHKKACKVHPEIRGTRCWECTGACFRDGYGQFNKHSKTHRFAYQLKYGKHLLKGTTWVHI